MKISVVTFPGSNCDEDAVHVARNILEVDTVSVWHEELELPPETDLVIIPGGFSYGDALRAGAIARFSPIMEAVRSYAEAGGLVIGICNGFQILVEAGLLPGAMLPNASQKFICKNVLLDVETTESPFTCELDKDSPIGMPIAHHEGRYYIDAEGLATLKSNQQIAFRYRDENPNGSLESIAGILNSTKNVLGMMPHPERASEVLLGSIDGLGIFKSVKHTVEVNS
ncbi:MAG: phosphoribosylformylglycinamidine synthase subunit PurQ [Myxococcota bacterium]|nr:phosphoribosylformylglycinamidine synthase subunit PurQ [Myxococcota bacterium]